MFLELFFCELCPDAAAAIIGTLMSERKVCGDNWTSRLGLTDAVLGDLSGGLSFSTINTDGVVNGSCALTWSNPLSWSMRC